MVLRLLCHMCKLLWGAALSKKLQRAGLGSRHASSFGFVKSICLYCNHITGLSAMLCVLCRRLQGKGALQVPCGAVPDGYKE